MIFLENHVAQNAFGASNRTYEDFYGEAAEGALNEWESGLIASADQVGFTPKYGYLQKFDPLDATDPSTVIDLLEAKERGEQPESQEALLEFSTMYPETFAMMTRMSLHGVPEDTTPCSSLPRRCSQLATTHSLGLTKLLPCSRGDKFPLFQTSGSEEDYRMDLNKLLEGRAGEINMKAKVASFGPAEDGLKTSPMGL